MQIAIDIETRDNLDAVPALFAELCTRAREKIKPEVPKSNNPKPETLERIRRDYEAKVEAVPRLIREKAALSPLTGRVVAVTVAELTSGGPPILNCFADITEEDAILSEFLAWWDANTGPKDQLITYNGRQFDIPFLGFRLAAGCHAPAVPWPRPRDWARVIDIMELVGGGKLNDCLLACGITPKVADGADVAGMEIDQLRDYTIKEMESFVELVSRLWSVGMV